MENLDLDINNMSASSQQVPTENSLAEFKATVAPTNPVQSASEEQGIQPGTPITPDGVTQIGRISSALYGGFVKILGFLSTGTTSQDVIHIREGKLNLVKNAGYIYADLSIFFEENDLDIIDPTKNTKLLGLIKGGDEVLFVKDNANSRYLISSLVDGDPRTNITLPQAENTNGMNITAPDLGERTNSIQMDIDTVESIQNATKAVEADYLKFELDENFNIVSISTSDDIFKQEFIKSTATTTEYKIFNPFAFTKPDDFYIEFYRNGDDIWVKTISTLGMIAIEYSEKIDEIGEFDTFSL